MSNLERWEVGFRNIVTILLGPATAFDIPDVVEMVRELRKRAEGAEVAEKLIKHEYLRLWGVWCDAHDEEPLEKQWCPCCAAARIAELEAKVAGIEDQGNTK